MVKYKLKEDKGGKSKLNIKAKKRKYYR